MIDDDAVITDDEAEDAALEELESDEESVEDGLGAEVSVADPVLERRQRRHSFNEMLAKIANKINVLGNSGVLPHYVRDKGQGEKSDRKFHVGFENR